MDVSWHAISLGLSILVGIGGGIWKLATLARRLEGLIYTFEAHVQAENIAHAKIEKGVTGCAERVDEAAEDVAYLRGRLDRNGLKK